MTTAHPALAPGHGRERPDRATRARRDHASAGAAAEGFPLPDRAPASVTPEDFPTIIAAIREQNRREVGAGNDVP
jgi:hypothetical protein